MPPTQGISRRDFLILSAVAAAGLALPHGCASPAAPGELPVDDRLRLAQPAVPAGVVTVGVARLGGIEATVRKAIELAGGLSAIRQGDTVVIKPNLTTGYSLSTRVTTHPEVLRAVIRVVKEKTDAGNITVAEASAYTDPSTRAVAGATGAYAVVESEGVNFLAWEDEGYVAASSFAFRHINFDILVPRSLTDGRFKHFINVPMLKNHEAIDWSDAQYTCCIKNHVGVVARETRTRGGGKGIHQNDLGEKVAELNLAVPEHAMNVVDALTVVLSGGPASLNMRTADPGIILACPDRVACDSLALAVLRHYAAVQGVSRDYVDTPVWEQAQIVRAQQLNLGRRKQDIRVSGEGVPELESILERWN